MFFFAVTKYLVKSRVLHVDATQLALHDIVKFDQDAVVFYYCVLFAGFLLG